ncbi:MAG: hypothetical protein Q7S01_04845 [bacterium]|nr:hypothetical protein [bacterium]
MIPPEKVTLLESLVFGQRVAEEEPRLEEYFVETLLWRKILRGEIDIVYGMKGSGKSAIFHLLTTGRNMPAGIRVIPAEYTRGTPVFNAIKTDPPPSEVQFVYLWKLYVLSLIANDAEILKVLKSDHAELVAELGSVGVIGEDKGEILKKALRYVDTIKIPNLVEVGISHSQEAEDKRINVDRAMDVLNHILSKTGSNVWVLFDRLDSVFDDNSGLEENALRALFKTYRDFSRYDHICLKIFLRTDIWKALTSKGFREASHITQSETIEWSEVNIVNLIVRRILSNPNIATFYHVVPEQVLANYDEQKKLFYRIFPDQIDAGSRKSETIRWLMTRVGDGTRQVAPRELIHLLNQSKDEQIKALELGESVPDGEHLFSPAAMKRALPAVSQVRLEQTIFAEYPNLRQHILMLESEKATQTLETLSKIWNVDEGETLKIASTLVEIGFFELRGEKRKPEYWVPFLYRPHLKLIQGKAEEDEYA